MAPGKTVLATGVFDILHLGHLRFLQESKKRGGPGARLVVVIARDRTVQNRKGQKPVMPEDQRREIVAALKPVNKAILGHKELDFLGILRDVDPDIVTVGYDQNDIKAAVNKIIRDQELPVRVVQIRKLGPRALASSTGLKKRVVTTWKPRPSG